MPSLGNEHESPGPGIVRGPQPARPYKQPFWQPAWGAVRVWALNMILELSTWIWQAAASVISGPLHYKVHMFYDAEKNAFCYFSANELPYKYADIVCRHYVLEHKCKQVYLFPEESATAEQEAEPTTSGPFVAKKEKRQLLQKELNKFIYMGKHEIPVPVPDVKPLSFLQFKFLKQG